LPREKNPTVTARQLLRLAIVGISPVVSVTATDLAEMDPVDVKKIVIGNGTGLEMVVVVKETETRIGAIGIAIGIQNESAVKTETGTETETESGIVVVTAVLIARKSASVVVVAPNHPTPTIAPLSLKLAA
jgi:hypothetical protein